MRTVLLSYTAAMLIVGAIVAVALAWARLSMLHRYQGPFLLHLWSTHGLHLGDLAVLAVELLLLMLFSAVLLAGLTRPR